MTSKDDKTPQGPDDAELEHEIRSQRKFSLGEAIAREGGMSFKGVDAVPRHKQAQIEISQFIRANVRDASGALKRQLEVRVTENETLVAKHLQAPLEALRTAVQVILGNDSRLVEFVRQVDQRYGQMYDVRPHFHKPGEDPHPDDEYTHDSVRAALEALLEKLGQD